VKITIEIEKYFGHPDNKPLAETVLRLVLEQYPDMLRSSSYLDKGWSLTGLRVEDK
jgi:hypothetical protein